jgi:anaerobic selenocysteine-containing dehydrogenase
LEREAFASCRICAGRCGLRISLDDDGRILAIHGDKANPLTRGYACIKGLKLHEAHYSPERLHHPLKRRPDGGFEPIPLGQALDEIAERLERLIEDGGARSVAAYKGTMAYTNALANEMMAAFLRALGSPALYSTMTIDQSAKWVSHERLGGWGAGKDPFETADVLLMVGTNPLVSLATFNFALQNPVKQMKEAKARGLKLIVIDPRLTETARHADLHLQPLPGEDPSILAGLLHIVLAEGWHDAAFCAAHVAGLDALRRAVAPFTPDLVAQRTGVEAGALVEAAVLFAEPLQEPGGVRRKRGSAASGTGPNMAPHGNLSEHLLECLNVVCGRFARPGDRVMNPGVLGPRRAWRAEVIPPLREWERSDKSPSGFGMLFGERMTGALADDILAEGPDRVRALIVSGGNPALAIPGAHDIARALRRLDLLVAIDPFLTPTARLAHYILPPRMMLERHDVFDRTYETIVTFAPYGSYDEPVIAPPEASEAVEDWVLFWELARRLGHELEVDGVALDMQRRPASEDLIALLLRGAQVPFEDLRRRPAGRIFDLPPMEVEPGDPSSRARFEVAPADVIAELAGVAATARPIEADFPYRLIVRRVRDVQNTMYHTTPESRARTPTNCAHLHPSDLQTLNLVDGDHARIVSAHGEVIVPTAADPSIRPGVISITHGWGALPDANGPEPGVNVNHLTSGTQDRDPINAMPVMTAIPVRIEPLDRR